jgi:DNA polymerase-3 subunit epsilon
MASETVREIVFDTETTGIDPLQGDRICEIGALELINTVPTGRSFHVYCNPQMPMPEGAFKVHGLSDDFLRDKPLFGEIADDFLNFISGAKLVAHNAQFDFRFLNAELKRINKPLLEEELIVDTLVLARKRFPGATNSLDALCSRFGIDNSRRTKHGALLDSELLAEVYIELCGGRQASLGLIAEESHSLYHQDNMIADAKAVALPSRTEIMIELSEEQKQAHQRFISQLGDRALWKAYDLS